MEYPVVITMFKDENPKSIFEVGCANGGLLNDVYKREEIVVGGLDQNEGDLGRSRARFPKYQDNFFVCDMNNIPWPIKDKQYDVAFTIGTLLYTEDPRPVLKEMRRIANKVMIAEPEVRAEPIHMIIVQDHHGIRHYHKYKEILEELGGRVESLGLVASKEIYKWT